MNIPKKEMVMSIEVDIAKGISNLNGMNMDDLEPMKAGTIVLQASLSDGNARRASCACFLIQI